MTTTLLPPLRSGDRLEGDEFLERYDAMTDVHKAELIDGVVYMPMSVSFDHGNPHIYVSWLIATYEIQTPGITSASDFTVRLDKKNVFQPDVTLFVLPERGGQSSFTEKGYLQGAPELVVEVTVSTTRNDLTKKKRVYRERGVKEYLVWQVEKERLDWFIVREDGWELLTANDDGITRSEMFPGLWIDADALTSRNMLRVLEVLNLGLKSREHKDFVKRLAKR